MTHAEAVQILKNSVISRGGNADDYTFSVSVQLMDHRPFLSDDKRSLSLSFIFCVQNAGGAIAYGTSWGTILESLDKHFGIPMEPITSEVPEIEFSEETAKQAIDNNELNDFLNSIK